MANITPANNDTDQYGYLITTEYGRSPLNAYQIQNVAPQVFGLTRQNISFPGNTVTFGSAYSLAVTVGSNAQGTLTVTALPNAVTAGTNLLLTDSVTGSTQVVVVRTNAAASATSVDYSAFTATTAHTFPATNTYVQVIVQAGVMAVDAAEEEVVAEAPVVSPVPVEEEVADAPVSDEPVDDVAGDVADDEVSAEADDEDEAVADESAK